MKFVLYITLLLANSSMAYARIEADTAKAFHNYFNERGYSLLGGLNCFNYSYGENGIARHSYGTAGHHPWAWALFVSDEFRLDRRFIMGPKVGGWFSGGASALALGINAIYYTDLKNGTLRLRPEIGFGFEHVKVVYGYNIGITGREFQGINTHNVALAFLVGFYKDRK